jgi:hypothetical protein
LRGAEEVPRPFYLELSSSLGNVRAFGDIALKVRFDHPNEGIHAARDFREDVGGVWIAELSGLIDCAADFFTKLSQGFGERRCVVAAI